MKIHSDDKGKSAELSGKDLDIYNHYLETGNSFKKIAEKFEVELHHVASVIDKGISSRVNTRLNKFNKVETDEDKLKWFYHAESDSYAKMTWKEVLSQREDLLEICDVVTGRENEAIRARNKKQKK